MAVVGARTGPPAVGFLLCLGKNPCRLSMRPSGQVRLEGRNGSLAHPIRMPQAAWRDCRRICAKETINKARGYFLIPSQAAASSARPLPRNTWVLSGCASCSGAVLRRGASWRRHRPKRGRRSLGFWKKMMKKTATIFGRLFFFQNQFLYFFFCVEGEVDIGCSFQCFKVRWVWFACCFFWHTIMICQKVDQHENQEDIHFAWLVQKYPSTKTVDWGWKSPRPLAVFGELADLSYQSDNAGWRFSDWWWA